MVRGLSTQDQNSLIQSVCSDRLPVWGPIMTTHYLQRTHLRCPIKLFVPPFLASRRALSLPQTATTLSATHRLVYATGSLHASA